MSSKFVTHLAKALPLAVTLLLASSSVALATGTSTMPWDTPMTTIVNNISGPLLRAGIIAAIIISGIGISLAMEGSWLRRGLSVVCGLSISAAAISWGLPFFGFAAGAGF